MITLGYRTPVYRWQFDATAQFNGPGTLPTPDAKNPLWEKTYDAYTLVGAQITKRFKKLSLYVGVENLFDFTQPHPIVASSDPWRDDFDATMVWGPVHGRKIYGGLRWNI
nr:TonB-dependent receptor [Tannerella forsythia]